MKTRFPLFLFFLLSFAIQVSSQQRPIAQKIDSLLISAKDSLIFLDSTLIQEDQEMIAPPSLEDLIKKGRTYSLQANEIMLQLQEPLDTTRFSEEIAAMQQNIYYI